MMCSTYAWRSNGLPFCSRDCLPTAADWQVYEPVAIRTVESGPEGPTAGAGHAGEGSEDSESCKGYERPGRGQASNSTPSSGSRITHLNVARSIHSGTPGLETWPRSSTAVM